MTRRANDALSELGKEMIVVGSLIGVKATRSRRRNRFAITFVNEHQVEITVIVQFPASKLAESENGVAAPPVRSSARLRQMRHAKAFLDERILQTGQSNQDHLGEIAQRRHGRADVVFIENVADTDT